MTTEDTNAGAVGSPVERPVRRPVPKRDKPMSYRQREMLAKAPADWGDFPSGVGCTNATLAALERSGLVELRIEPGARHSLYSGWQWRKTPNVGAKLETTAPAQK